MKPTKATTIITSSLLLLLAGCSQVSSIRSALQNETNASPLSPQINASASYCTTDTRTFSSGPPSVSSKNYAAQYYVSPTGNDNNAGTLAQPVKTLKKANQLVQARIANGVPSGGIAIWLRGGVYEQNEELGLYPVQSGANEEDTIDWRGYPNENARVIGGKKLSALNFISVPTNSALYARLDASIRDRVKQINLADQGIDPVDFGTLKQRGYNNSQQITSALELFIDGSAMQLARWPDSDTTIDTPLWDPTQDTQVQLYGTSTPDVSGIYLKEGSRDGVFTYKRTQVASNGLNYYLWRHTDSTGTAFWLVSRQVGLWPDADTCCSSWYLRPTYPDLFMPRVKATGTLSFLNPERINHGLAIQSAPTTTTTFTYSGTQPENWAQALNSTTPANGAWVDVWTSSWSEFHIPLTAIDTAAKKITLANAPQASGNSPVAFLGWHAYNIPEEITQPGEWYLDRSTNILYLLPPDSFSAASDIVVSMPTYCAGCAKNASGEKSIFTLRDAHHITFRDFTIEGGRMHQISVNNGNGIRIENMKFLNAGVSAIVFSVDAAKSTTAGYNNWISRSTISGTGYSGIFMTGGDKKSITLGNNRIENNEIHHIGRFIPSVSVGVSVNDCGNSVRNNLFYNIPRGGIFARGNEHLVELNVIHDVCVKSGDCGAIYQGGDWGANCTLYKNNFIHDIKSELGLGYTDVHGIYLDETTAGVHAEGNLMYRLTGSAFRLGGGRNNIMKGNLIAQVDAVLDVDVRARDHLADLVALNYQQEPWASRYPYTAAIPNDAAIVNATGSRWQTPEGNVFSSNIGWQNNRWYFAGSRSLVPDLYFAELINNIKNQDPLFTNEQTLNLNLLPASPALGIPGFKSIPFEKMGIRPE